MELDPEIEQVEKTIEDFFSKKLKLTLKQISVEEDWYKLLQIELFEKKKINYSLGTKRLIENEIEYIENKYKTLYNSIDEIMASGFNESVTNSSTKLLHVFTIVLFRDYSFNEDFKNLEVAHVCGLYADQDRFIQKKIKDLTENEISYEILIYIIWGVNDCFYLQWLYGELENFGKEKQEIDLLKNNVYNFIPLARIENESCLNVLRDNFIDKTTKTSDFNKLFSEKGIVEKINWTASLPELSRFIFLLHTDYSDNNNKAVCKRQDDIWEISSHLFLQNGEEINSKRLKGNNRQIKNKERLELLLKAVSHLKRPEFATRK